MVEYIEAGKTAPFQPTEGVQYTECTIVNIDNNNYILPLYCFKNSNGDALHGSDLTDIINRNIQEMLLLLPLYSILQVYYKKIRGNMYYGFISGLNLIYMQ